MDEKIQLLKQLGFSEQLISAYESEMQTKQPVDIPSVQEEAVNYHTPMDIKSADANGLILEKTHVSSTTNLFI